jgi:hypothetical protein
VGWGRNNLLHAGRNPQRLAVIRRLLRFYCHDLVAHERQDP